MDAPMQGAYRELEEDMRKALKAHRGNRSVLSTMLNTLLLYPEYPSGSGPVGTELDPELRRRVRFVIPEPRDLPEDRIYSKERILIGGSRGSWRRVGGVSLCRVHAEARRSSQIQRILSDEGRRRQF